MKDASEVVHAGDADREGQLLIDELLDYCGWNGPTKRLRLNDMNPDAIRKALKEMKDNATYKGEYHAGQARSYADWLTGMNLSRYCSLCLADAGYDGVYSVGRVQTPTLGLVVRRDREIENFVPKPFFAGHGKSSRRMHAERSGASARARERRRTLDLLTRDTSLPSSPYRTRGAAAIDLGSEVDVTSRIL